MKKKVLVMIMLVMLLLNTNSILQPVKGVKENAKYGGTLILACLSECLTFNPLLSTGGDREARVNQMYNSLVTLDWNGGVIPDLAESWEVSEDGLSYTFHLSNDVKWHDGEDFTSADVKFTYDQYLLRHDLRFSDQFSAIESSETPDPYTVVFHLKRLSPTLMVMGFGQSGGNGILPKHLYEGTDIFENEHNWNPVGTGPFKFEKWAKGDYLILVRNDNYFKEGLPYLDRLVFKIMPSWASQMIALETGEAHFIVGASPPISEIPRLKELEGIAFKIMQEAVPGELHLLMNLDNPYLGDLKVRQAMAYAINKQEMMKVCAAGVGTLTTGPVAPSTRWAYNPDVPTYPYDPDKAEMLLDEAGYPRGADGIRFKFTTNPRVGDPMREDAAAIFKAQMAKVGIEVEILYIDFATLVNKVRITYDYDTYWVVMTTGPDPDRMSKNYHSKNIGPGLGNCMKYNNSELDMILDDLGVTMDTDKRKELAYEAQRILATELPAFWFWELPAIYIYNTDFKGIPCGAHGANSKFETGWWVYGKDLDEIELASTSKDIAESIGGVSTAIDTMNESLSKLKSTVSTLQIMLAITLIVTIVSVAIPFVKKS